MARSDDPALAHAAAAAIVRTLRAAGHTALLAGGCVRDTLLGLPATDVDVATSAPPEQVRALFPRTHAVGEAFGVILVRDPGALIEVATFRADGPYSDQRRPDSVVPADARQDAARRDFTINALFLDPLPGVPQPRLPGEPTITPTSSGNVVDYAGGVPDLRARVVRAVGDPRQRLAEDHLRALRAVRFTARLNFTLEGGTARAISEQARELAGVSRERVGDEVRRMLAHESRAVAVELLHRLGLDGPMLTQPARGPLAPRTVAGLGAALALGPPGPARVGLGVALAAWALDQGEGEAGAGPLLTRWRGALCLSNDERGALRDALSVYWALRGAWSRASVAEQKRLAAHPGFADAVLILSAADPAIGGQVRSRYGELQAVAGGIAPEPLVTGDDLVALGWKGGPNFKKVLNRLYDEQLEGRLTNKYEGLELVRRWGV